MPVRLLKLNVMLKKIRVTVSILIFSLLTFFFLDFAELLPKQFHIVAEIQFIPALLALNIIALITVLGLTILFGRIYCSSICPMGVFQDSIDWLAKKLHRKKNTLILKKEKFSGGQSWLCQ
jgi:polyferredoxin